jgi:putative transposase
VILLAERGVDVSKRTVRRWVQHVGPLRAAEIRKHRRPLGTKWYVDEVVFFRGKDKHFLYRAVDGHGQGVDVLFRAHRDTASATAFCRQALARPGWRPAPVIRDHHRPGIKAIREVFPAAEPGRTGRHRVSGETTMPIGRRHVFARDRLRMARGPKALATGQRFFEGRGGVPARRPGHPCLAALAPDDEPARARAHNQVRAVALAVTALGARLTKAAAPTA